MVLLKGAMRSKEGILEAPLVFSVIYFHHFINYYNNYIISSLAPILPNTWSVTLDLRLDAV